MYDWGYRAGTYVNKSCGVAIGVHDRISKATPAQRVVSPPWNLQGRGGAVRYKNRKADFDFLLHCGLLPSVAHEELQEDQ